MGAGASSVPRLRKALFIKAYNQRSDRSLSLADQFLPFSFRGADYQLYILPSRVLECLGMKGSDYDWIQHILCETLGQKAASSTSPREESAIKLFDFIQFLETGTMPVITSVADRIPSTHPSPRDKPPYPPSSSAASFSPDGLGPEGDVSSGPEIEEVSIHLSHISPDSLPANLKLKEEGSQFSAAKPMSSSSSNSTTLIVPPNSSASSSAATLPVWCKREVVITEKITTYITLEGGQAGPGGGKQELVEREVTQHEVLHMEVRANAGGGKGDFAHRETTQYHNLETFNGEVVGEIKGTEEYVHLKNGEDEFTYVDSTMPPREPPGGREGGGRSDKDEPHGEPPPGYEEKERDDAAEWSHPANNHPDNAQQDDEGWGQHDDQHEAGLPPQGSYAYPTDMDGNMADEVEGIAFREKGGAEVEGVGIWEGDNPLMQTYRFAPTSLSPQPHGEEQEGIDAKPGEKEGGMSRYSSRESLHDID
eukprot:gene33787-40885_t